MEKIVLDEKQLKEVVLNMKEFQEFRALYLEIDSITETRMLSISKDELAWVVNVNKKYPNILDFYESAANDSILKYKSLNPGPHMIFESDFFMLEEKFLKKLNQNYEYPEKELQKYLSPYKI